MKFLVHLLALTSSLEISSNLAAETVEKEIDLYRLSVRRNMELRAEFGKMRDIAGESAWEVSTSIISNATKDTVWGEVWHTMKNITKVAAVAMDSESASTIEIVNATCESVMVN